MTRLRFVLRRFGWAILMTGIVLSGLFVLVAAPPDPNAAVVAFGVARSGGNASAAMEAYQASRRTAGPLLSQYAEFMWNFATLQWGRSLTFQRPVAGLVGQRSAVTAAYVLPSVLLSTLLGTVVGLYVSVRESSLLDRLVSTAAYAGYGLPAFWLALVVVALLSGRVPVDAEFSLARSPLDPANLWALSVPTLVLTVTLFAVQLRYVRSEIRDNLHEEFVKTVRAKGVSSWRVARHALRAAALPLLSLLFTEFLAVLFLAVFTLEAALGLPGLGNLLFTAIERRDVPVVVACGTVPVLVGVYGNLLQDLLQAASDPRIGSE